ncbi:unnamed protein product [Ambrosiozyma monospora]|uniref:Unnamed protein product n=1 Tax=Ambrosiozyma monospora TaxID=43982 RepID=A0ACB5T7R1_AMBMO|nr:unnamed protein product [Ambrosiozyma monospora]
MFYANDNAVLEYLSRDLLTKGSLSDIQVNAFGKIYKLHSIIIRRSPYFKSWNLPIFGDLGPNDKPQMLQLNIITYDSFITKDSFELMLKRLYGCIDSQKEKEMPLSMIATADFFQLDDIKWSVLDNYKFDYLTTQLAVSTLKMLDKNDFGDFVFKLEYKCKSFLQDNGWYSGDQEWKDLPVSLIPEIVNSNQFFVPTEFDRIVFATRLFQLSDSPETDIKVVLKMFKSQLCFFTLTYNQQLYLLKLKLKSGEPIFDESMVKASNKLSKHLQNTTCSDKGSPISTEKSPDGTAFPKYRYPVDIQCITSKTR